MSKILIIEDNLEIRENLYEFLELSKYTVIMAKNGKKGIACINEELPDLILCDIAMPEMNGYQVLEYIKASPTFAKIPFVFTTSSAQKKDIENGRLSSADAYLIKPFSTKKLIGLIDKLLIEKHLEA